MAPSNQVYPFATTFKVNQSHSMIDRYLHQNLVQSGEKGFESLTCGFGDHCSTIRTILLRKKRFLVYGICTYLCLFSNKFATFLDLNWCFFFICFFFQLGLSREIVSLRMWFWSPWRCQKLFWYTILSCFYYIYYIWFGSHLFISLGSFS